MSSKEARKVENFLRLKKEWMERFCGEDRNSITRQLQNLSWYITVFRTINESRKFSLSSKGEYENNGMLHNFIDKCFFEYLLISLRRLLDKDSGKSTCSLYRLIVDMEKSHHLMTRRIYFMCRDLEYDVEKVKEEYERYKDEQLAKGNNSFSVAPRLDWKNNEYKHCEFDKLSGIKKDNRKPTDCVQKSIFNYFKDRLDEEHGYVVTYVNKFVAHLATPCDREKKSADEIDLTLGRLCETHETLCKIAIIVGKHFLEFPGPFLGTVCFDQFEHIDVPFVETENVQELRDIWTEYSKKIDSLAYLDVNNYDSLMKNNSF